MSTTNEPEPGTCTGSAETEPVGGGLIYIDDGLIFIDGGLIFLGGIEDAFTAETEPGPCVGAAESFNVIDNNGTLVVASGVQVVLEVD